MICLQRLESSEAWEKTPLISSTMSVVLSNFATESDGTPNNSGGSTQHGASYFFGFLITFVVLLLIFVGCGVVSRRRFSARQRARFEWNMQPWAERMEEGVGYVPPVLVEKSFASTEHELSLWKDMIPLAALVVTPRPADFVKDVSPSSAPPQTSLSPTVYGDSGLENVETITRTLSVTSERQAESLTRIGSGRFGLVRLTNLVPYRPNAILAHHEAERQGPRLRREDGTQSELRERAVVRRRHGWLYPSSWPGFPFRHRRERGISVDVEQGTHSIFFDEKPQQDISTTKDLVLQVAVLVQMPSQALHTLEGNVQFPAYEIGVANVPWTDELRNSRRSSSTLPDD